LKETVGNYDMAIVYAGLDDKELSFKWLEKGLEQHDGMMVFLKHWAMLVPWFSTNARMDDLLKKVGLQ